MKHYKNIFMKLSMFSCRFNRTIILHNLTAQKKLVHIFFSALFKNKFKIRKKKLEWMEPWIKQILIGDAFIFCLKITCLEHNSSLKRNDWKIGPNFRFPTWNLIFKLNERNESTYGLFLMRSEKKWAIEDFRLNVKATLN